MAKKCPKNFSKILQQRTLTEAWFSRKKQAAEQNEKSESDENNSTDDKNLNNDDSDFVERSQDTTESKLRKKVNQTVLRSSTLSKSSSRNVDQSVSYNSKSTQTPLKKPKILLWNLKTPISSPKKNHKNVSPSISDSKLSISDVCEVNSTVIREEIDEMLQNVNDFESIEMKHDLSSLITGEEMLSNKLEYPTSLITCEASAQRTNNDEEQEEQDPLYIVEKEKNRVSIQKENRKKKKHINIINKGKKQKNAIDNEKEQLSEEFLMTLRELYIKLQHTVPPQHKIESCAGSRPLTEKETLLFESFGPLKKGHFTKLEDEIIKKNWTNFCKVHDWNEELAEPFLTLRHEGRIYYIPSLEERKKFVRFLANGLPWRSLYSVYFRFKNLYNRSIRNSHYSPKDDKKIIAHFSKVTAPGLNTKCADLAKTLNRKRKSIWQRYQRLKIMYNLNSSKLNDSCEKESVSEVDSEEEENKKNKQKKETSLYKTFNRDTTIKKVFKGVKWSFPLVNRFIEKLMEIMTCENLKELKNQTITDDIWKKMECKIRIDHTVLKNFWNLQLHMQLFCPKPLYFNDLKINLIEYLYKTNFTNANSIDWDEVKLNFTGVTSTFLSKLFDHLQKYVKTKLGTTDIKKTVGYLYNTHIPELEENTTDTVLPKLHYKNGRIISFVKASEKSKCKGTTINPLSDD